MNIEDDFDFCKRVQIMNFFAKNSQDKIIDKIELLDAVFFADRYHLLKYGRTVSGDSYHASKYGPIASNIDNICTMDHLSNDQNCYIRRYLNIHKNSVRSIREWQQNDADLFSVSDMEAMNESLMLLRKFKNAEIIIMLPNNDVDIIHYSSRFCNHTKNDCDIDIDEFFNILPDDDFCAKIDPELRELNRKLINY